MRTLITFTVFAALLTACAPNLSSAPNHLGVVQQRGASGNVQTVQLVVIPSSASCQLSSTAYRHGMHRSGLLSVPIKASPVTVYCTKGGHSPAKRTLANTLEEPGGLATEAIVGGFFGLFKSVMTGKGQRYPPMLHMILPTLRDDKVQQQQIAYNRELIEANWRLLKTGRDIECNRRGSAVETSIWSIHCETARFANYKAEDLRAFDTLTQRYGRFATISISTNASRANPVTPTQVRAGNRSAGK